MSKEGVEVAKEKLEHTYERTKEGLHDLANMILSSTRHYYEVLKRKFDQFTHISEEEYQTAKTKLAEIKRQTFEMIAMAKEKGIDLSEELIQNTKNLFAKQEEELEEMAHKVKENIEKDKTLQKQPQIRQQPLRQQVQPEPEEGSEWIEVHKRHEKMESEENLPHLIEKYELKRTTGWQDVPLTEKRDAGKIWSEIGKTSGERVFEKGPTERKEGAEKIREGSHQQYSKKDL